MAYSVLPVIDDPKIDESLMGYALRMSEVNHFTGMQWLANVFQVSRIQHLSAPHMPAIAWMFGSCPSRFNGVTADLRQSRGESHTHAYGHLITRSFLLRLRQPQICPACLEEEGFIQKMWDFSLITCCPRHGTVLVEVCAECGQKLNWRRPGIATCRCGFDLRRIAAMRAHENALCFANWFGDRLRTKTAASNESFQANPVLELLDPLSTDGAMRLLWAIGIKASVQEAIGAGKTLKALPTSVAAQCVTRGIGRLFEIYLRQNLAELRPAFVLNALHAIVDDGLSNADRLIAAQLITCDKKRANSMASLLHLHPLSQIKLF